MLKFNIHSSKSGYNGCYPSLPFGSVTSLKNTDEELARKSTQRITAQSK